MFKAVKISTFCPKSLSLRLFTTNPYPTTNPFRGFTKAYVDASVSRAPKGQSSIVQGGCVGLVLYDPMGRKLLERGRWFNEWRSNELESMAVESGVKDIPTTLQITPLVVFTDAKSVIFAIEKIKGKREMGLDVNEILKVYGPGGSEQTTSKLLNDPEFIVRAFRIIDLMNLFPPSSVLQFVRSRGNKADSISSQGRVHFENSPTNHDDGSLFFFDSLTKVQSNQKEMVKEENPLQVILEASKKAVIQGSMGVLLDFRLLLDDSLPLLSRMKDLIIDWIQEGFQDFFRLLYDRFLLHSGKINTASQDLVFHDGMQGDKTAADLVLILAQLSLFVDQTAIPRITEDFRLLLDDSLPLLSRMKDLIIDWIQEGFQDFFRLLYDRFLLHSGKINTASQDLVFHDGMQGDKTAADLVLILAQLSLFVDQTAIPRITELEGDMSLMASKTEEARSQLLETHLANLFK